MNFKSIIILSSAPLLASLGIVGSASAGQLGLEHVGMGEGRFIRFAFNGGNMNFERRVFAGERIWEVTQGADRQSHLRTFSFDIFNATATDDFQTRNLEGVENWQNNITIGPAREGMLEHLYANHYDHASTGGNRAAQAFQVAVWEVVNERRASWFNLDAGRFKIVNMGNAAKALAASWLEEVYAAYENNELDAFEIFAALSEDHESQLLIVPAPAPALLAAFGLAGAGLIRRRMRQTDATD